QQGLGRRHARRLASRASEISRLASATAEQACGAAASAARRLGSLVRDPEADMEWSNIGWGAAVVLAFAAGCGVMFLMDPAGGAGRRALLREKGRAGFGRTASSLQRTGRNLWDRVSGGVSRRSRSTGSEEAFSGSSGVLAGEP